MQEYPLHNAGNYHLNYEQLLNISANRFLEMDA